MPIENLSVPFITRKMLAFEGGQVFALRISSRASSARAITIRGITKEGAFTVQHTTTADGYIKVEDFRMPDIPIMISVLDTFSAWSQGQNTITVTLVINGDEVFNLCSGSVYGNKGISWPATALPDINPGHGDFGVVNSSNPAAGAEHSVLVPTNEIWRVRAIRVQLVAAAVAVSRRVHIVFNPTDNVTIDCFSGVDQTTGQTENYSIAPFGAIPDEQDGSDILIAMPTDMWLSPGGTIKTKTTNLDAGDNYGIMFIYRERFWSVESG